MSEPVLEARGLTRRFGGVAAVSDVSFSLQPGRLLGLIGPNGAGKTTLINLVIGHVRPSAGTVAVAGQDLTGAKPWTIAASRVARTFQIVKPFRGLTVRENVAVGAMFGPSGAGSVAEAGNRADEVLERVGLAARAGVPPGDLNVADARRLELAKALAMRPRVLLLDEVMAGLRREEMAPALELIRSLKSEGLAIVAVEHVMKVILEISDEVLVMHEGAELTRGPPEDVVKDDRVIEAYLGRRYAKRAAAERAAAERAAAEGTASTDA